MMMKCLTKSKTILATKPVSDPKRLLQEILRDADTFHFGTKDFKGNE